MLKVPLCRQPFCSVLCSHRCTLKRKTKATGQIFVGKSSTVLYMIDGGGNWSKPNEVVMELAKQVHMQPLDRSCICERCLFQEMYQIQKPRRPRTHSLIESIHVTHAWSQTKEVIPLVFLIQFCNNWPCVTWRAILKNYYAHVNSVPGATFLNDLNRV